MGISNIGTHNFLSDSSGKNKWETLQYQETKHTLKDD